MKINEIVVEAVKQRLDPKCWKGKHKEGTKIKGGVRVNNCVPNESIEEHDEPCCDACAAQGTTCESDDGVITGKEMLSIFKKMHHEHGYNKPMERWIANQTWSLDTIEPEQLQDMYNDDEDSDPFERTIWLDDAAVTKYERILRAGQLVNPIIMGPNRTVIDGNHRAQAAKNLHVSVPGYVPIKKSVDESKVTPSAKYLKLAKDLEDYANEHIPKSQQGFGDFMYHAELIRKGHQDIHKQDLNTVQQRYRKTMSDMIKQHLDEAVSVEIHVTTSTGNHLLEAKKRRAKTIIDGMIKTLIKQGRTHDEAIADLKRQVDARFYEHIDAVAAIIIENFADGKGPGRPGDSKRHGIPKHASLATLDKLSKQGGRKGQLAHWQANMRRGRAKTNENDDEYDEYDDDMDNDVEYYDYDPDATIDPDAINDIVAAVPEAQEIWFHGSRAIGGWHDDSDWDLLVVVPDTIRGKSAIELNDTLHTIAAKYPNYDIQSAWPTDNITLVTKEEGHLLWSADDKLHEQQSSGSHNARNGLEESLFKAKVSFPDGDIYLTDHLFDRKEEREMGMAAIEYMISNAARYHGDEISTIGAEDFVIRNRPGAGIGVAKVLQPDDTYKYIIRTIHPTLRSGRYQTVIRLDSKHKHKTTNEAIAPHGDSWNELNLMKIGEKPVALVGPHEFENLYKPVMRKYKWIWTHLTVPEINLERYIIGQPGQQARIARMQHLVLQMNKNLKNGIKPDAEYHREMGKLLGYSDTDISDFIKKLNL